LNFVSQINQEAISDVEIRYRNHPQTQYNGTLNGWKNVFKLLLGDLGGKLGSKDDSCGDFDWVVFS
jgi:hypothetical protein